MAALRAENTALKAAAATGTVAGTSRRQARRTARRITFEHGEIVISAETARANAAAYSCSNATTSRLGSRSLGASARVGGGGPFGRLIPLA